MDLVRLTEQTSHTSHRLLADDTLFVITVSALEMDGFLPVVDGVSTSLTVPVSSITTELVVIITLELFPQGILD